jgi:predicted  nucleic acid-binding Zn-ribbon protein
MTSACVVAVYTVCYKCGLYYTDSIYKVYKDTLQNCSCNQFHYIGTYKQVETNSKTKNKGGNNGGEK